MIYEPLLHTALMLFRWVPPQGPAPRGDCSFPCIEVHPAVKQPHSADAANSVIEIKTTISSHWLSCLLLFPRNPSRAHRPSCHRPHPPRQYFNKYKPIGYVVIISFMCGSILGCKSFMYVVITPQLRVWGQTGPPSAVLKDRPAQNTPAPGHFFWTKWVRIKQNQLSGGFWIIVTVKLRHIVSWRCS